MNNTYNIIKDIYDSVLSGSLIKITEENKRFITAIAVGFLDDKNPTEDQLNIIELILKLSNVLYNNCTTDWLVLEDGVYDVVLVKYESYRHSYPVGATPVQFNDLKYVNTETTDEPKVLYHIIKDKENALYYDDILRNDYNPKDSMIIPYIKKLDENRISRNTPHNYPKLVGTLDKCKFVLNKQAKDMGVLDDPSIKVFERDFIDKHLEMGIIKPDEKFYMVAELKYDGISVEADVTNQIISARSRGDTEADLASDLTPIFEGYPFKRLDGTDMKQIGMKFEAILTYDNLEKLTQLRGKDYKNCRNAMVGIVGALDGRRYRDLITLVPLATSVDEFDNRIEEIEFLNKYYTSGINLKYAVLYGTYIEILFQVKKFVEEAEYLRPMMPFMYDGVVVSYIDKDKIAKLGRENFVNKYSIAIKFNTMKKQTTFTGYSYAVGQNGMITPMIHYYPVEFYGTIHTKSSGHSLARFNELNLAPGDIITVEYVNDVMPYVTKPDLDVNKKNPSPPSTFITKCPCCGTDLVISDSGKSIFCPNIHCGERNIMRMSNFLAKLRFKDFSEQSLRALNIIDLESLSTVLKDEDAVRTILGDINGVKFCDHLREFFQTKFYDYELIGALGFSSIAMGKWKLIFKQFTIPQILEMSLEDFSNAVCNIKGIGPGMIETIKTEMPYFVNEIKLLLQLFTNIQAYNQVKESVKIRFTGFRDAELVQLVKSKYPFVDIGEGSVTKDTNILLVPIEGHTSTKTIKAQKDGVQIVPVTEFRNNLDKYLL